MKKEVDQNLLTQKENVELKANVDDLHEVLRDRDIEIVGFKKTISEIKSQMEKFAIMLGVQNDYATILGEIEKLLHVEDDVQILRSQVRSFKTGDKEEVGKAIVEGEKAVKKLRGIVDDLNQEIRLLRARRNVDKYKTVELAKETIKKFFKGIIISILKYPRVIFSRIKRRG